MITNLEGKFHDFGTSVPEFVATNYDPSNDEVIVKTKDVTIYKSGVVRGWSREYSDKIAHAAFSFVAMEGQKYAGTTFGGYSMTKELLNAIKEKYPTHVNAAYIDLMDRDTFHVKFLDWCKEHNINVLGFCYGSYQIENCPELKDIPFWLKGDKLDVEYEDQDGYTWPERLVDALFMCDVKAHAYGIMKYYGDQKYHIKVSVAGKKNADIAEFDIES